MATDRLRSPVRLIRRPLLFSHISAATLPPPPLHPSLQAPQISSVRTPSIHTPLTSGTAGLKLKGTSSMLSLSNSSIQVGFLLLLEVMLVLCRFLRMKSTKSKPNYAPPSHSLLPNRIFLILILSRHLYVPKDL